MSRVFCAIGLSAVLVASCSPTSYTGFSKPGVTQDTVSRDETACSVEANRLFPAANFTNTVYGGYGTRGGFWAGTSVQVNDANASIRAEHRRDCMTLKGYTPVIYPICTQSQLAGRNYQTVAGAPAPAPNICAIRTQNRTVAVIDLNKPV